jgi:carbohydrate-selective porin OprB
VLCRAPLGSTPAGRARLGLRLLAGLVVLGLAMAAHADDPPDWNPLAAPANDLKRALHSRGLDGDLRLGFFDQHASQTLTGNENLASFLWESNGSWDPVRRPHWGAGSLHWTFEGSFGLGHDVRDETLAGNVGALHGTNSSLVPNRSALDQVYWQQVSPGGELRLLAGQIDHTSFFDQNLAANDAFTQFFASGLENNESIPFPTYGGFGAIVRFEPAEHLYVMVGAGDSASDNAWGAWKSLRDDSWLQLVELGVAPELPLLGRGHYRIIPWHNHFFGEDGWGLALSFDQQLGRENLLAFFRYGLGDGEVTLVEASISGGLTLAGPFGRSSDHVGLGVSWSKPSGFFGGGQRETSFELYYALQLSASISLTPDLQVVIDPAYNTKDDTVVVVGVRLLVHF